MKTNYDHIHFEYRARGSDENRKTWCCMNNKNNWELGCVFFYKDWNTFIFTPSNQTSVYSSSCLRDIAEFIDELNNQ